MPLRIYRKRLPASVEEPAPVTPPPAPAVPAEALIADDDKPIYTGDLNFIPVEP